MPFHFKKKESVAKAARRLCCERIDDALENLKDRDRLKSVHEVRKEIKKLRAILRLVRGEIGKNFYRKSNEMFRKVAVFLTAIRDSHVKLNAFEALTRHFKRRLPKRPFPKIKKVLQKICRAEERKFLKSNSISKVKRLLRKAERQVENLKIKSDGWAAIRPGLKKSFSRGREACKTVLEKSSPENFHEWRKRVKDLWHYLQLLCPAWSKELRAAADELQTLGELLGDDHDLVLLKEAVADICGKTEGIKLLNELIESRQKELRSAALKRGARFFAEKPSAFCRRFENYWKIWRGEK